MTQHRFIQAVAGGVYPHGSPVRLVDGLAMFEANLARIDGVTRRPPTAGADVDHQEGEPLEIRTDGYQLSALPDGTRWTVLRDGKIEP